MEKIIIYNGFSGTREIGLSLYSIFRSLLDEPERVCLSYDIDLKLDCLWIIVCSESVVNWCSSNGYPKRFIAFQMDPPNHFRIEINERAEMHKLLLSKAISVWEYSPINLISYPERIFVPIGYHSILSPEDILSGKYLYSDDNKDCDVLFMGFLNDRRNKISDRLFGLGLRVWFTMGMNLEEMKKAIRRTKICLNLHREDGINSLETARLNILLSNRTCVVSERSDDKPYDELYENNGITFSTYDDICDTCVKLVMDPKRRIELAHKSYSWYITEREWSRIVDFKRLLIPYNYPK